MKLLLLFLLAIETVAFGQKDFFKNRETDLELGINVGSIKPTAEIGISILNNFPELSPLPFCSDALILATEFNYSNNQLLFAPKLTYSYNLILVNFSASLIDYNYNNLNGLYFRPNIGITTMGNIDLVYGYNIPLQHELYFVNTHTLTMRCRLFTTIKALF